VPLVVRQARGAGLEVSVEWTFRAAVSLHVKPLPELGQTQVEIPPDLLWGAAAVLGTVVQPPPR
jgi:hypothetical protein